MKSLTDKELGAIHKDWLKILEPYRGGIIDGEEKEKITEFAKLARKPIDGKVVPYADIIKLIKDEFDYEIKRTTLIDWINNLK